VLDSAILQRLLAFSGDGVSIIDRAGDLEIEYQPSSDIGNRLFLTGGFERREVAFACSLIERDRHPPVVLDVGANVGVHSITWAQARDDSMVYAFEPSPQTSAILERNVGRNGVAKRVVIVRSALSNAAGVATFHECSDAAYSSLKDTGRKHVVRTVDVETITLDEFVWRERLSHITLLKIDVEGAETEVIAGATETLRSLGPDILIEIYGGDNSNPDPERAIALIREHGYHAYVFIEGRLQPFERHDDRFYNYYFTKRATLPNR
jgi:FkbM family methyltransferase